MKCRMLCACCVFLTLVACHSNEKKQTFKGVIEYDSLTLEIDFPYLSDYQCLTPVFYQDTLYAAGGNRFDNGINLLNIYGGKHREISVEREGPNGVLMPLIFCFTEGKFIVREQERISVLDMSGQVLHRFPVKDLTPSDGGTPYRLKPFGADIVGNTLIQAYDGEVFIPLATKPTTPTSSIGAVLDCENAKFNLLPIYNPEEVLPKRDEYDGMAFPYIMPYQDRLIISFPYTSQAYVYDRTSGQMTNLKMNSSFIPDEIDVPANIKTLEGIYFLSESPRYREVHYSPDLHKYYRFAWGKNEWMSYLAKSGERTSSYLIVYDELTGENREYKLPMSFSARQNIVHNDTLYVALINDTDDFFHFAKINLAKL